MKVGDRVHNRYEIIEELGRGGFSIVYAAEDHQEHRPVAVKLLVPPPVSADSALERLRREVRAVKAVDHPSIVPIYELIESEHRAFVVMARIFGKDVGARVRAEGPSTIEAVVALGQQIAGALAAAHARSIIHRDVKPANILLGSDRAYLVDFGSARMDGDASLTRTGGIVGTLDFSAPEMLAGERVDARADIYALGMTLFFALTGRLPEKTVAQMAPTPAEEGHSPRAFAPMTPSWLDRVIRRATMADPRRRFPTAVMFARALDQAREGDGREPGLLGGRFCLACASTNAGSEGLCRGCRTIAGEPKDTMIFVSSPQNPLREEELAKKLSALRGEEHIDPELGEVVRGHRALVVTRARNAHRVVARLEKEGLTARAIPASSAYRALPAPFFGMLTGVVLMGGLGASISPLHPIVGGVLAFALYFSARKRSGSPWVTTTSPARATKSFPERVSGEIDRTLGVLEEGRGRELLIDVLELLQEALTVEGAEVDFEVLDEVALASCQAARALDRAGRTRKTLETRAHARRGAIETPISNALERVEESETALTQRLLEALAAASLAGLSDARSGTVRLDEAKRQLAEELELRCAAMAEVEESLRG